MNSEPTSKKIIREIEGVVWDRVWDLYYTHKSQFSGDPVEDEVEDRVDYGVERMVLRQLKDE